VLVGVDVLNLYHLVRKKAPSIILSLTF
jgi:hypothetical protein